MKIRVPQSQARLFGRAGESVTRSDRRQRELGFESPLPPLTARPNRRRDDALGKTTGSSPLRGAPNERKTGGKTLTPVGHPFMSPSERRFAPTTVRQARNGVRYGLEQVSAFIGIRSPSDTSNEPGILDIKSLIIDLYLSGTKLRIATSGEIN
jgi:hypothetical protein